MGVFAEIQPALFEELMPSKEAKGDKSAPSTDIIASTAVLYSIRMLGAVWQLLVKNGLQWSVMVQ